MIFEATNLNDPNPLTHKTWKGGEENELDTYSFIDVSGSVNLAGVIRHVTHWLIVCDP